jgi:hypothetical protein
MIGPVHAWKPKTKGWRIIVVRIPLLQEGG